MFVSGPISRVHGMTASFPKDGSFRGRQIGCAVDGFFHSTVQGGSITCGGDVADLVPDVKGIY